jgi:hypothetical protein
MSKDQISIITEGVCQAEAMVGVETLTHSSLCTACTMAAKPTTAQKTALSSLSLKERRSKIPSSLYNNHRLEKNSRARTTVSAIPLALTLTLASAYAPTSSRSLPSLLLFFTSVDGGLHRSH